MPDKSYRGNASQFFVAGELCRRGHHAVVTLGNTPNTDILCSNHAGTKFVHVQVKTFVPGNKTCSVGRKAQIDLGKNFFWVLGGIPTPKQDLPFEYYVIPSPDVAREVSAAHDTWLKTKGAKGQPHNDSDFRTIRLPQKKSVTGWDISVYRDAWDLIDKRLSEP